MTARTSPLRPGLKPGPSSNSKASGFRGFEGAGAVTSSYMWVCLRRPGSPRINVGCWRPWPRPGTSLSEFPLRARGSSPSCARPSADHARPQVGGPLGSTVKAPDPVLMAAAAMVFVPDLGAPVLDAESAHHLLDVLRLRAGQSVVASDGMGSWVPCRVTPAAAKGDARRWDLSSILELAGAVTVTASVRPRLTVAFAPVKGDRPEWVVQKLTELGVDRIVPILTARSVVRWEGERATKSVERLRRVAREAATQSRRAWLPEVATVSTLGSLASLTGRPTTLACPGGGPPHLGRPVVAIGPEGGWDRAELEAGFDTVGLGSTILRAETAAVAAGTLLCALRQQLIAPLA